MTAHRVLAFWAIMPVGAVFYFFLFWTSFEYWRRSRVRAGAMMLATFLVLGVCLFVFRDTLIGPHTAYPAWVRFTGWSLFAIACVLGTVADRQIGVKVRSFMPFFQHRGHIELKTTGAYGLVRHPIYAAGAWFMLSMYLVTGYVAVLVATVVFYAGALWFTRQEERRLVVLLDDPGEYDRYRQRVPALIPRIRPRSARAPSAGSAAP